jgi:hypothetical protein
VTPEEFFQALAEGGGMEFADDDPSYCPVHDWECPHRVKCSPDECELGDCCR